jgi:hypothetical protein
VGAGAACGQLHQPPDDEQAETGAVAAAAARQSREFLEDARAVRGAEADAAVAHVELHGAVRAARAERDAATTLHGGERVLEDVAYHDVERERIARDVQIARELARNRDLLGPRALLELHHDAGDRTGELHGFRFQLDAPTLEARALEDLRDHQLHAREVREHPLDERTRRLGRWRAQRQGFERQLQTRERRLELMRYEREEAVLLLVHARLGAQRPRDHRDARRQRQQEERALPGVLVVTAALLGGECLGELRRERRATAADDDRRQQLLDALDAHAGIEQRLRRGCLLGVARAGGLHLVHRIGLLVEEPPSHLHGRHQHQCERRQLKDARRLHPPAASAACSA